MATLFSNPFYGYKIYNKYLMPYKTYCKIFKAKTIADLPQEFPQLLIYLILSFLIGIYEPIIIKANKINFTIFRQLCNLL